MDFFGPAAGLPPAISPHNNFYIWGPGGCGGTVVLSVCIPLQALRPVFRSIRQVAVVRSAYCVPQENGLPVYLDQSPTLSLNQAWPGWKNIG